MTAVDECYIAPNKLKRVLSLISFATKGLSLNPKSIHNVLNLDFLLEKGSLRNKKEIILWHDVLNNTITKHRLNNKKAETVPNLIQTLRKHSWRSKAIIYRQRECTRNIFEDLRKLDILVIPAGKKLISRRKQNEWWYQSNLQKIHPSTILEIKFLETILKRFINLESLVKKYRPLFRKRSRKKEAIERTRKEAGIKSKRRTRRKIRKARNSKVRNSFFYRFYSGSYLELSCSGAA